MQESLQLCLGKFPDGRETMSIDDSTLLPDVSPDVFYTGTKDSAGYAIAMSSLVDTELVLLEALRRKG